MCGAVAALLACSTLLALTAPARPQGACSYAHSGYLTGLPYQLPVTYLTPGVADWMVAVPLPVECADAGGQAAGQEALACDHDARPGVRNERGGLHVRRGGWLRGHATVQLIVYCVFPYPPPPPPLTTELNILPAQSNMLPARPNALPALPNMWPAQPNALLALPNMLPARPNALPALPNMLPARPNALPALPNMLPAQPNALPALPNMLPARPNALPALPNMLPAQPNALPALPNRSRNVTELALPSAVPTPHQSNDTTTTSPELSSSDKEEYEEESEEDSEVKPEDNRRLLQWKPTQLLQLPRDTYHRFMKFLRTD